MSRRRRIFVLVGGACLLVVSGYLAGHYRLLTSRSATMTDLFYCPPDEVMTRAEAIIGPIDEGYSMLLSVHDFPEVHPHNKAAIYRILSANTLYRNGPEWLALGVVYNANPAVKREALTALGKLYGSLLGSMMILNGHLLREGDAEVLAGTRDLLSLVAFWEGGRDSTDLSDVMFQEECLKRLSAQRRRAADKGYLWEPGIEVVSPHHTVSKETRDVNTPEGGP